MTTRQYKRLKGLKKENLRDNMTTTEIILNMLDAFQAGILTDSTKERLEAQREERKLYITQAQLTKPRYTKEQIVSWISRFKYGKADDPEYQKQIIDTFINSIYVFDDRLVFTYNYKDGTETMTLDDIQAAFGSDFTQVAPPKQNGYPVRDGRFCFTAGELNSVSSPSGSAACGGSEWGHPCTRSVACGTSTLLASTTSKQHH